MSEWQPIETAPKDGTQVDVWVVFPSQSYRVADAHWNETAGESGAWQLGSFHEMQFTERPVVTHWMPLPAPPRENR